MPNKIEDQFQALLEDLRTDAICAERDGLKQYAADCRAEYARLCLLQRGGFGPMNRALNRFIYRVGSNYSKSERKV